MGGPLKKAANIGGQAIGAIATGGTSLIPGSPTKKIGDVVGNALTLGTSGQKGLFPDISGGMGGSSDYTPQTLPNVGNDPASVLAQTGGAPLLASIAMGVDVKQAMASYFGAKDYDSFYSGLDQKSKDLVDGVTTSLTQIQTNTDLRNQAVQKIVQDFPNIAANAAKARQAAGGEFDEATKGAVNLALNQAGAKFATSGSISSGAANEAFAKVGAEHAYDKLNYENSREATAYNDEATGWKANYDEANALRGFQQTMLGLGVQQGFSASQAALQRSQGVGQFNANANNEAGQMKANQSNAAMGAVGQLGGTILGAAIGGPAGAAIGSNVGKMVTAPPVTAGVNGAGGYR